MALSFALSSGFTFVPRRRSWAFPKITAKALWISGTICRSTSAWFLLCSSLIDARALLPPKCRASPREHAEVPVDGWLSYYNINVRYLKEIASRCQRLSSPKTKSSFAGYKQPLKSHNKDEFSGGERNN